METIAITTAINYMFALAAISFIVGVAVGLYVGRDSSWRDA